MAKIHIVNHTHWDREWYFTTADALVLSESTFTEVLDELERNPGAMFCLDGQSSIIEEYIEIRPRRLAQLVKFVKQGRLSIGPWFTQTDAFLVNGESIIRNLILGIRDCQKYGGYMNIGYLPDTFGFHAQMPAILNNCGINSVVFFRGINFDTQVESPYFVWKGLSDSQVLAVNLLKGYGAAAFLEDSEVYRNNKLVPLTKQLKAMSKLSEVLIPIGEDQLDIIRDLPEKLESISQKTEDQYVISSYEQFIKFLQEQQQLELYQGEFREPCLSRVHKTLGSVRYDIKQANFNLEQQMLHRTEPLMAIARANHIEISEKLLHKAWKKMLETHAHDSMGGCVSDNVAVDILHRMKEAKEIADGIENMITKRLSEQIGMKENEVLVFNPLPYPYSGYKQIQLVASSKHIKVAGCEEAMILKTKYYPPRDHVRIVTAQGERYYVEPEYYQLTILCQLELPAMGYRVVTFESSPEHPIQELEHTNTASIANEYYQIEYQDQEVTLTTRFGKKLKNFITFEDCGNDGDTYDFSPLAGDQPVLLSLSSCQVMKTALMEQMVLDGEFTLPYQLEDRLNEQGKRGLLKIQLKISLLKDTNRIEMKCTIDNQIYSHRIRARINTDIPAKETIAALPFGYIRRKVQETIPANWQEKYVEIPIDLDIYDGSVSVESTDYHVTAFSKGMKEYQFREDSFYLTLLATTSQLGKENLLYRPGRPSGDTTRQGHEMIATPMAELLGIHEFEFALCISEGLFDGYQTAKRWQDYTLEHISYQSQTLNKFIYRLDNKIQLRENVIKSPAEFSLLELDESVLYSSITPSLYSDAVLLRLKNPTEHAVILNNFDFSKFSGVERVNYIETVCDDQMFIIPAFDTLTLKLSY